MCRLAPQIVSAGHSKLPHLEMENRRSSALTDTSCVRHEEDTARTLIAAVLSRTADLIEQDQDNAFSGGPSILAAFALATRELIEDPATEVARHHLGISDLRFYQAEREAAACALRSAATSTGDTYTVLRSNAATHQLNLARGHLGAAAGITNAHVLSLPEFTNRLTRILHDLQTQLIRTRRELAETRACLNAYFEDVIASHRQRGSNALKKPLLHGADHATFGRLRAQIRSLEDENTWLRSAASHRSALLIIARALHDAWPTLFSDGFEHEVARVVADRLRTHARERYYRARARGVLLPDIENLHEAA